MSLRLAPAADADAVLQFLVDAFAGATLDELERPLMEVNVPQTAKLSELFARLENAKATLHVVEASVTQTTLEQVFVKMAKDRGEQASGEPTFPVSEAMVQVTDEDDGTRTVKIEREPGQKLGLDLGDGATWEAATRVLREASEAAAQAQASAERADDAALDAEQSAQDAVGAAQDAAVAGQGAQHAAGRAEQGAQQAESAATAAADAAAWWPSTIGHGSRRPTAQPEAHEWISAWLRTPWPPLEGGSALWLARGHHGHLGHPFGVKL